MYLFKTPVLRPVELFPNEGYDFYGGAKNWLLCIDNVAKYFELPPDVKKVQFFAYGRSAKNRVKFEMPEGVYPTVDGIHEYILWETEIAIEKLMRKHKREVVYIELEYE